MPPQKRLIEGGVIAGEGSGGPEEIWEDQEVIALSLRKDPSSKTRLLFGKRTPTYHRCTEGCCCFNKGHRTLKLKNDVSCNNEEVIYTNDDWKSHFGIEEYLTSKGARKGGETCVVEEKEREVHFYSKLKYTNITKLSFSIENDDSIECPKDGNRLRKRICAKNSRISYVTYRPSSKPFHPGSSFEEASAINAL